MVGRREVAVVEYKLDLLGPGKTDRESKICRCMGRIEVAVAE